MNKIQQVAIYALLILLISSPIIAEEVKFNDVPQNHWAKDAVYDLVKKGITQGYPDGTFGGGRNITRYETAVFLSKLAAIVGTTSNVDVSALKADIQALKEEIDEIKKSPSPEPKGVPVTGDFIARYRVANTVTTGSSSTAAAPERGPRVDYRLKMTLQKDFDEGTNVKVNLDTMDAGWNGGDQDLARRLLDIEGNVLVHLWDIPLQFTMTAGPGPIVYTPTTDAVVPSDIGTIYDRPRNSIFVSALLGAIDLKTGYTARTLSATGEVDVSQVTASIGYTLVGLPFFDIFKINLTGDHLSRDVLKDAYPYDSRGKLTLTGSFNETATTALIMGVSESETAGEGYYMGWELMLADTFNTGTYVTVKYHKIGSEYIVPDLAMAEFDIIGLDMFDKALPNNIQDWGLDIIQHITRDLKLKGKLDLRLTKEGEFGEDFPETSTTLEGGLSYNVAQNTLLELLYKVYQVPSDPNDPTTDVLSLIFQYKF